MGNIISQEVLQVSKNIGLVIEDVFGPKDTSGHCLAQMLMLGDDISMSRQLVGNIRMLDDRVRAIQANAFEKILRAMSLWVKNPNITLSSAQSADPSHSRYAGGVIFPSGPNHTYAMAISGYEALEDEAGVLEIGLRTGRCDESYVRRVIETSNNDVFNILHNAYRKRFG